MKKSELRKIIKEEIFHIFEAATEVSNIIDKEWVKFVKTVNAKLGVYKSSSKISSGNWREIGSMLEDSVDNGDLFDKSDIKIFR